MIYSDSSCVSAPSSDVLDGVLSLSSLRPLQTYVALVPSPVDPHPLAPYLQGDYDLVPFATSGDGTAQLDIVHQPVSEGKMEYVFLPIDNVPHKR